jgi:transposase
MKLRWWDGDGLCLFAKRLEGGRFLWPKAEAGTVHLSRAQLSLKTQGHGHPSKCDFCETSSFS